MASSSSSSSLPISLQHVSTDSAGTVTSSLHLLPFHIAYSGKADVAAYFNHPDGDSKAYFRGRMLIGSSIDIPTGYTGQIWKSNGPSMVVSQAQSQHSQSNRKRQERDTDIPSIEYNTESPRRSPRKHAQQEQPAAKKQKVIVKKKKPVKRQVFAMSPDASPVKEIASTETVVLDEEMLDQKLEEAVNIIKDEEPAREEQNAGDKIKQEQDAVPVIIEEKDALLEQKEAIAEEDTKRVIERAITPPPVDTPTIHTLPTTPSAPSALTSSLPQTPVQQQIAKVEEAGILEDTGPLVEKKLMPISRFDKFTIWNPDNVLDKGSDEYVRSLNEWIGLAELIHT